MSAASSSVRTLAAAPHAAFRAAKPRRPRAEASRTLATATAEASSPRGNSFPPRASASRNSVTPEAAQAYLNNLLSLPPSAAFPPSLALQALTHKSYRFVHRLAHAPPYSAEEIADSEVPHNARLSFIGRRALQAYAAMFLHANVAGSAALSATDLLRGKSIEHKLDALRHDSNLGRTVGEAWRIGDVMRWDGNETGREGGHAKVKGLTTQAVLGAIFSYHGSAAAQRAYHLHFLPHYASQLRDPALIEAAERVAESAKKLGGVVGP